MKKRILSALLVLALACGLVSTAWAADPVTQDSTLVTQSADGTGPADSTSDTKEVDITTPEVEDDTSVQAGSEDVSSDVLTDDTVTTQTPDGNEEADVEQSESTTPADNGSDSTPAEVQDGTEGAGAPTGEEQGDTTTDQPSAGPESVPSQPNRAPVALMSNDGISTMAETGDTGTIGRYRVFRGEDTASEKLITINVFDYDYQDGHYGMPDFWRWYAGTGINYVNGEERPFLFRKTTSWSSGTEVNGWHTYALQGIVRTDLDANGYPQLQDGTSLAYLFNLNEVDGKTIRANANNLFQKNGNTYSFDSAVNYAYLDNNNEFWLYDKDYGSSGFFPFNTMGNGENTHFGMTVDFSFYMPQGGMIDGDGDGTADEQMTFNFSGDDDVWVFIDGKLALDIGGIHGAMAGNINFATGVATVNQVMGPDNGSSDDGKPATVNLWELFGYGSLQEWQNAWAYEPHTLKFFYLERGAGESNCKIDFNMPTVSANDINVAKSLEDSEGNPLSSEELAAMSDDEKTFTMQLVLDGVAENYDYSQHEYTIGSQTHQLNKDGTFTIQAGQFAAIKKIDSSITKYTIKEILPGNSGYDVYFDDAENPATLENSNGSLVATSGEYSIDSGGLSFVTVHNRKPSATAKIYKVVNFTDGTTENLNAVLESVTFTVYDSKNSPVAQNVSLKKEGEAFATEDGKYYAEVAGLKPGETYTVTENCADEIGNYQLTSTTADPSNDPNGTDKQTGKLENVSADVVQTVTFTNTYSPKTASLTIQKMIQGLDSVNAQKVWENLNFDVTVDGESVQSDNMVKEQEVTEAPGGGYTATVTISGLTVGKEYTIKETNADLTGYSRSTKIDGTEAGDDLSTSGTIMPDRNEVTFTNIYTRQTGSLVLEKKVIDTTVDTTDNPDANVINTNQTFTFTVTAEDSLKAEVSAKEGGYPATGDSGKALEFKDGVAEVVLTGNASLTFEGLPTGDYTVTEGIPENSLTVNGKEYTYVDKIEPDNALTVTNNGTVTATITNQYRPTYQTLTVKKQVKGNMGSYSKDFHFTLTLTQNTEGQYGKLENSLQVATTHKGIDNSEINSITAQGSTYDFDLKHGEEIEIQVPFGYTATVTETAESSQGYDVSAQVTSGKEITTSASSAASVKSVSTDSDATVEYTNEHIPVVPSGITDNNKPFTLMITAAGIAGLALIGSVVARRVRRRREE